MAQMETCIAIWVATALCVVQTLRLLSIYLLSLLYFFNARSSIGSAIELEGGVMNKNNLI